MKKINKKRMKKKEKKKEKWKFEKKENEKMEKRAKWQVRNRVCFSMFFASHAKIFDDFQCFPLLLLFSAKSCTICIIFVSENVSRRKSTTNFGISPFFRGNVEKWKWTKSDDGVRSKSSKKKKWLSATYGKSSTISRIAVVVVTFFDEILHDFHDFVSECVSFPKNINNQFWGVTVFPMKSDNVHWM